MRRQYDFGKAKRGPVVRVAKGKTRITIRLDEDLIRWFKSQVHETGGGSYQALTNAALHEYVAHRQQPLEATLRRVLREELKRASQPALAADGAARRR